MFGIGALLGVEKIPYRRVGRLEDRGGDLLVVADPDLSPSEIANLERQPAIVLNGGTLFARQAFGAANPLITHRACAIALDEPVWPPAAAALGRRFGKAALRIPAAPVCETTGVTRGTPLAWLSGPRKPAIVGLNRLVWSTIDLGTAFVNLLTEDYLPKHKQHASSSPSPLHRWCRRVAESMYYAAPDRVRQWAQARIYGRIERRVQAEQGYVSESPIDATGWLLIELVKGLIKHAGGTLVRLEKWPAPYCAAATLTHDIEPSRYAYTAGLERLLNRIAAAGYPATLGLVAGACDRYLPNATVAQLRSHAVICHGLEHRGENVAGQAEVTASVQSARGRLERRLKRRVTGYRSPRLDRSSALTWALDQSRFRFDSSYPDVDRENMRHFGAGVRLNVPFRPPVPGKAGTLRASRCLELPLTAPDCIQPLFAGRSVAQLRSMVASKLAFICQTGGLYLALVHGGVFGERDSAVRGEHLEFVYSQLRRDGVWLAGIEEIVEWWCRREAVRITIHGEGIRVINTGAQQIAGVRLIIEQGSTVRTAQVPALNPGEGATILASGATPPCLARRYGVHCGAAPVAEETQ
ncbi:MAG: hypothetical protein ACE5I7_18415 [Candidatus Binatia bacterium]